MWIGLYINKEGNRIWSDSNEFEVGGIKEGRLAPKIKTLSLPFVEVWPLTSDTKLLVDRQDSHEARVA